MLRRTRFLSKTGEIRLAIKVIRYSGYTQWSFSRRILLSWIFQPVTPVEEVVFPAAGIFVKEITVWYLVTLICLTLYAFCESS